MKKQPAKKKTRTAKTRVVQITHDAASRPNNPTAEMEELAAEKSFPAFYARNPDLDPQLVWTGKDAENAAGKFRVDAMPVYVQEKISPKAIIEDLRRRTAESRAEEPDAAANLFGDFNGLSEDARVEFYQHAQKWTNRMILGDSLLVMTSLAHKENFRGTVQCVYMDPPYGIKFSSNWQPSTKSRAVKDGDETGEPEVIAAFRDTWKLGIHSYLSYMRDRLTAARDLLTETGSIFVQISDENVHLVRSLMDEVFGRENFVVSIVFKKTGSHAGKFVEPVNDYLLWFAKNKQQAKIRQLFAKREWSREDAEGFNHYENDKGDIVAVDEQFDESKHRLVRADPLISPGLSPTSSGAIAIEGKSFKCTANSHWKVPPDKIFKLWAIGRVIRKGNGLSYKRIFSDFPVKAFHNIWDNLGGASDMVYVVQTSEKVIQRCMLMTTDPGDLVLDPTCGSGTTAAVAEKFGRRWITMDSSRVALTLARARLMGACYDYYLLRDSEEGAKKESELSGKPAPKKQFGKDVRHGFVYERAPHITLRAIANNKEIDALYEEYRRDLETRREKLNAATGNNFAEWQIPAEADPQWRADVKELHSEYLVLRQQRQYKIDRSISRNAEMELLVDRPYKAKNAVRVSGPFTMESLSPHRILPTDAEDAAPDPAAELRPKSQSENEAKFLEVVREHLFLHGVQGKLKNERLTFTGEGLEQWTPGRTIHFVGRYEQNGGEKRAAICIGPEYGTVTRSLIINAAREAADICDMLVVVGFAFEGHADEKMMNIGRLPVLRARINNDLHMSDRLKTGKGGHLFVSFGEPDINIRAAEGENGGLYRVEILGVDIFNPATGAVHSSGVEDIACWMIDTDYNEQSFFARHAYFCEVGKDPYKKLKNTLKAEISPEAWETLYSSVSRPFPAPAGGKIAVKVINHYGDEVMKVFPLAEGG